MTTSADVLAVPPASEILAVCSAGCFAPTLCQPPPACLERCLAGDPKSARLDGCTLVRRLAEGQTPIDIEVPARCDRGLSIDLRPGFEPTDPNVLILSSPAGSVRNALAGAMREQCRLSQENDGLASEVIHCYEQVNLIFDFSSRIAELSDPQDVCRVLLDKLLQYYNAEQVLHIDVAQDKFMCVLATGGCVECGWTQVAAAGEFVDRSQSGTPHLTLPTETRMMIGQLENAARVAAGSAEDDPPQQQGHGTSLWGPLYHNSHDRSIVGVVRRSRFFESVDMLLLDSMLTFAGHILSNMCLAQRLQRSSLEAVRSLVNTIDQKDPYTCGHSERVGFLARAVGQQMGLSHSRQQELEWGGLLHDVGKIGIPEHVLCKPGKLTDEEFAHIKQHPARGFSVLQPVESLQGILEIVLHHHESPDGSGYPAGLKGDEIPLPARIVHVVDIFDALTSTRSYRKAFGFQRAVDIMKKEAGPKLDAEVFDAFLQTWERLPQEYPLEWERWFAKVMELEA